MEENGGILEDVDSMIKRDLVKWREEATGVMCDKKKKYH